VETLTPAVTISGQVFQDLNANGVKEAGDTPQSNVLIFLDGTGFSKTSDANGNYNFLVAPGSYRVREVAPAGFTQSTATPPDIVSLTMSGNFPGVDFGNFPRFKLVTIAASDSSAAEAGGTQAPNPGQFIVTRFGSTDQPLTVFYSVGGSTANGADYQALSGTVTIPAGASAAAIDVNVLNDSITEGTETVTLTLLSSPSVLVLAPTASATVVIADNETGVPPGPGVSGVGQSLIVVAPEFGAGPHVKAFDAVTGAERLSFFAYAPSFTGGVTVATGDVNGDGFADVITGPASNGPPNVKVFDGRTGAEVYSFMAFGAGFFGGVNVAAGDVDGDGRADIIVSVASQAAPHVAVFSGRDLSLLRSFYAYGVGFTGGVRVAAADVDGDGRGELVIGGGAGNPSLIRLLDGPTLGELDSFFAFGAFGGGIFVNGG
jgi:hypothetical protein